MLDELSKMYLLNYPTPLLLLLYMENCSEPFAIFFYFRKCDFWFAISKWFLQQTKSSNIVIINFLSSSSSYYSAYMKKRTRFAFPHCPPDMIDADLTLRMLVCYHGIERFSVYNFIFYLPIAVIANGKMVLVSSSVVFNLWMNCFQTYIYIYFFIDILKCCQSLLWCNYFIK